MSGPVQVGAGAISVVASGMSGLVVWGSIGGIATAGAAIATLVLSVTAGNRRRRREHEVDIREAEQRGEARGRAQLSDDLAEARRERDEYRERYLNIVERGRRS